MKTINCLLVIAVLALSVQSLKYVGNWNQIPGGLAHISVDYDGRVWGCNSGQGIYTREGPNGSWQNIPGGLKQVSVRNGQVWGVNSGQGIYYRDGVGGSWVNIPGGLNYVTVDNDGRVFGVNAAGNIYTRDQPFNVSWQQLDGALSQVDVMDGIIVGVNSNSDIFWRDWNDKGLDGSWATIDKQDIAFRHLSIDRDGSLLGTDSGQRIYRKKSISEGSWEIIYGGLKMIDGKGGVVWGCNSGQGIYNMDNSIPDDLVVDHINWKQIGGSLKQVSVDVNGEIWGVNSSDNIYRRDNAGESTNWIQVDGSLKNVDITNGQIWGVNSGDKIYERSSEEGSNWGLIPGGLKQISSDVDGTVWAVNSGNAIYTRQGVDGNWQNIPGGLKQVDVANGWVWGVNAANNVYKRKGASGSWSQEKGSLKWISINYDGRRWGIDANDNIFTSPGDAYGWQQVNGSLKQINTKGSHIVGVNVNNQIFYANIGFNCGAVFNECSYAGDFKLICDKQPKIDFTIKSVYVPEWTEIKLYNQEQFEGQTAIFEQSVNCIDTIEFSLLQKMGIKFKKSKNLKGAQTKSKVKLLNKHLKVNKKSHKRQ